MATILDSLVGSFAKKLQDIITEEAFLILGVKEELGELQRTKSQIQCFLNDAEQRRTEQQAVNNWFGELRDAMYDADDIIDLATFEGSKLLENHPSSSRNSTACSGISLLSCFPNIKRRHEIAVQIRNLNTRIEKISKLGGSFLTRSDAAPVGQSSTSKLRYSSHLVEPNLVGKEIIYSSRKLVDLVLAHKENKDYKLAIVGTGGVGKTTLAQKIYNDQRIKGNFKKHAWICVSQEYKEVTLLKEVLRKIGVHQEQGENIEELQSKLAETIEDSSFLLVLDDVWQFNVWTDLLRTPLHAAAAGVILVTTRDDTIAMKIGVEHTHRVDLMSVDVGWELLWKSMNINEEKEVQNLEVDHLVFKKLPLLRVWNLTGSIIQSIPGCIECLIHLRLLDLDDTDISCLPESIGSLKNLQILNLQRCEALHSLPSAITKLCNLRRLGLRSTPINQVPKGIGKLKFLNDFEDSCASVVLCIILSFFNHNYWYMREKKYKKS